MVDRIATVIFDTHAESSSEVAHNDLTHASPSTHGDEVPELDDRFEHASTVRVLAADSQSKSPSMQCCARARTNKYGQENLEYWHDMECRQLMKVLKIKSCKTKAWEPDHCMLVNVLKLIFCDASHLENWNILCPAVDSPVMWMFDGQKFQQTKLHLRYFGPLLGQSPLQCHAYIRLDTGHRLLTHCRPQCCQRGCS